MFNSLSLVISFTSCFEEIDLSSEPLEDLRVSSAGGNKERILSLLILQRQRFELESVEQFQNL